MRKYTYFISDLHLGAKYFNDPKDVERKVCRWLDSIKDEAKTIYMLGDILDYWYEYKYVVPRGFTRFFGKIAELTDAGIEIIWYTGNHDIWIFDYLPEELGVKVVTTNTIVSIDNHKFFLGHGDDVDNRSKSFHFMRSIFHNRVCQKLFSSIHPRWTVPFAHAWSSNSRKNSDEPKYFGEENEYLVKFAKHYSETHDINYYIFGHRHIMLDLMIKKDARIIVLGDWLHFDSYAVYDGTNMSLCVYENNK